MHLNFSWNAVQILWILTLAASLVLLVVLMGRDRTKRFPWFTAAIALSALRLLTSRLLYGRIPQLTMGVVFITLADISAVIGLLVLVEMARKAFRNAPRSGWIIGTCSLLAAGAAVLYFWGPWPQWKTLESHSLIAHLTLLQFLAQKMVLLTDVLTVGLGLLVILLARRFAAGWHSHVQRILVGLMTASVSQLAIQAAWQTIAHSTVPHSQAEYDRVVGIHDKLINANGAVYVCVLIWWIVCLWMPEPGTAPASESQTGNTPQKAYLDQNSPSVSDETNS